MLHDKNFKCRIGLCIFQQHFLRTVTAYNDFPSPRWQAPFSWGIVLQAALLNCCLSSRGNIQHLWFSMNIIFRSCKVLWRWKQTLAEAHKGCCESLCSCPLGRHNREPGWWADLTDKVAEGSKSRGWVRTAQRPEGVSDGLCSWLRVTKSALARRQSTPRVRLCCEQVNRGEKDIPCFGKAADTAVLNS